MAHEAKSGVDAPLFTRAIMDYLPSRDERMLRYMELLAVFEASNRRLLPPKYRDLTNAELEQALHEARLAVQSGIGGRTL
jgi:hypothetical protein